MFVTIRNMHGNLSLNNEVCLTFGGITPTVQNHCKQSSSIKKIIIGNAMSWILFNM